MNVLQQGSQVLTGLQNLLEGLVEGQRVRDEQDAQHRSAAAAWAQERGELQKALQDRDTMITGLHQELMQSQQKAAESERAHRQVEGQIKEHALQTSQAIRACELLQMQLASASSGSSQQQPSAGHDMRLGHQGSGSLPQQQPQALQNFVQTAINTLHAAAPGQHMGPGGPLPQNGMPHQPQFSLTQANGHAQHPGSFGFSAMTNPSQPLPPQTPHPGSGMYQDTAGVATDPRRRPPTSAPPPMGPPPGDLKRKLDPHQLQAGPPPKHLAPGQGNQPNSPWLMNPQQQPLQQVQPNAAMQFQHQPQPPQHPPNMQMQPQQHPNMQMQPPSMHMRPAPPAMQAATPPVYNPNHAIINQDNSRTIAQPRPPPVSPAVRQVYLSNLPYSMDNAGLHELASSTQGGAAAVVRVEIDRRPDGKSKGTGHVVFADRRMAEQAVKDLHRRATGGAGGRTVNASFDRLTN
ncbi:hypothetical protein WJX73_004841 [Symbiochloris irregularis]|uniref:RRM domain-containing protein n=1 Tax=Symbiochloris irregularis TaxID=706552 RepID=A0AAW1NUQ5_9CHLO